MGPDHPFRNAQIAAGYENWYLSAGRQADRHEKALLKWLLAKVPKTQTLLDVGCGTGHFTHWFNERGIQAIGLDQSQPMLGEAKHLNRTDCVLGEALTLPFASKSFDLVTFITTLEFILNPYQALTEAVRVCRYGLILGVLNADSRLGKKYKQQGGAIWDAARFYTPQALKRILLEITPQKTRVVWRTTLWPFFPGALPLPWGGFIGMVALF